MIYWFYEYLLKRQIDRVAGACLLHDQRAGYGRCTRQPDPYHIVVQRDIRICGKTPPSREDQDPRHYIPYQHSRSRRNEAYLPEIRKISTISRLILHIGDKEEIAGSGMDVVVAIGNSGKEEITACIRKMAEDHVRPADVDEKMLESYLTFKYTPDV